MSETGQRLAEALEAVAVGCEERAEHLHSTYALGDETAAARWLSELAEILRGVASDQVS
ncbi:hypothetical protein [Streptomyces sp. WZ-12]|uniref:hypothetical protein n=1 Tax=Streptomyces sp. WZ-12 TaxID=3030210 RepID=UPI002380CCC9|nr:hypothetical protein [Streptomyces sp. WZ-12]